MRLGSGRLSAAGVDEAENKWRWVLAHHLQCGLLDIARHGDKTPPPETAARLSEALDRLARDEPVQYVIGETDFMGFRFFCDARALIPRPETELLVEHAEAFLTRHPDRRAVVDVCTGSGCIACAMALRQPSARVRAVDISADALALARKNAAALHAPVEFIQADLLSAIADDSVDVVTANPPYITSADCDGLPRMIRHYEPRLALDGGAGGLDIISRLVLEAARVLTSGGILLMEIGDEQADAVKELLWPNNPALEMDNLIFDYAGRARVIQARRRSR